jgi:uncharacterized membrane protein YqiK
MLWTYLIAGAVALVVLLILFRMVWRVAEPNEALIISGLGAHASQEQGNDTLGFKIVVGRGTAVLPGFQTVAARHPGDAVDRHLRVKPGHPAAHQGRHGVQGR